LSREVIEERGWAMTINNGHAGRSGKPNRGSEPTGVWNRGSKKGPVNPIRVRTKRLDQIDGDKIALAFWLLAKQIVENGSDQPVSEEEARLIAAQLDDGSGGASDSSETETETETGTGTGSRESEPEDER
jgi:hypothetical protein